MKKLIALLLVLVMTLGLCSTVLAAGESYTITIEGDKVVEGHVYEAYQVFAGNLSTDGKLSDVEWGSGVDTEKAVEGKTLIQAINALGGDFAAAVTAADVAKALEKINTFDAAVTQNFAKVVGKYLAAPAAASTYADEKYVIDGLEAGYYLVKDKDDSQLENDAYTRYILNVVKDVTVNAKSSTTTSDKVIVDNGQETKTNEASIGDTVTFKLKSKVPDMTGYNYYYFVAEDTLSKGLTFDEVTSVKVGGKEITAYHLDPAAPAAAADGTTTFKIVFENFLQYIDLKGQDVVITYNAVLNENAEVGEKGNPNTAKIKYSNNPNFDYDPKKDDFDENDPVGITPGSTTNTYTTSITVTKTDDKDQILTGAEFTLTGDGVNVIVVSETKFEEDTNGTYWKLIDGKYTTTDPETVTNKSKYEDVNKKYSKKEVVTVKGADKGETTVKGFVKADGTITFTGLGAGSYTLTETVTPEGFNTCDPIKFNVSFDPETKEFASDNDAVVVGKTNTLATKVINTPGTELPSTGGIGTKIFYIIGGALVLAAVVLLITRKRMSAER